MINFDFPKSTSDYLHRAGRAGRAGRPGFVISLCRDKDEGILEEMRAANENNEPLKIKGSAYSLKNKEKIISDRKKLGLKVSIGSSQASAGALNDKPRYVGSQLEKPNDVNESRSFKQFS